MKGDFDHLAVKIAGKVEDKDFKQRRAVIESRAAAKARDASSVTA